MEDRSESLSKLLGALFKARADFPTIERGCTGQLGLRKYKYANLGDIMAAIQGPLQANDLQIIHQCDGSSVGTTLFHSSGEWISTAITIDTDAAPQAVGSAITYMRRYGLCALLSIVTEDDDDGRRAGANGSKPKGNGAQQPREETAANPAPSNGGDTKKLADTIATVTERLAKAAANLKINGAPQDFASMRRR